MNVLIVNGSPRKNGTTVTVTRAFGDSAKENGAEVRAYNLNDMRNIHGCQSCTECWKAGK